MRRVALLLAISLTQAVHAQTGTRCGTDAFGNTVCMDKDGVISIVPRTAAGDDTSARENGEAAGNGTGGKSGEQESPHRCAVDAFGNTVCN